MDEVVEIIVVVQPREGGSTAATGAKPEHSAAELIESICKHYQSSKFSDWDVFEEGGQRIVRLTGEISSSDLACMPLMLI